MLNPILGAETNLKYRHIPYIGLIDYENQTHLNSFC
jgi:hypothetical protein